MSFLTTQNDINVWKLHYGCHHLYNITAFAKKGYENDRGSGGDRSSSVRSQKRTHMAKNVTVRDAVPEGDKAKYENAFKLCVASR